MASVTIGTLATLAIQNKGSQVAEDYACLVALAGNPRERSSQGFLSKLQELRSLAQSTLALFPKAPKGTTLEALTNIVGQVEVASRLKLKVEGDGAARLALGGSYAGIDSAIDRIAATVDLAESVQAAAVPDKTKDWLLSDLVGE